MSGRNRGWSGLGAKASALGDGCLGALALGALGLGVVGCAPAKTLATPEVPQAERVEQEHAALRCAGDPRRMDCGVRVVAKGQGRPATVESTVTITVEDGWPLVAPAPLALHPLTVDGPACRFSEGCDHRLRMQFSAPSRRAPGYRRSLSIAPPPGWSVAKDERAQHVDITLTSPAEHSSPGGPVVDLGHRLGTGGFAGVARVGWEAFAPLWLSHGATLEARADGDVVAAYVLSAVTRRLLVLPALSVGAGVPLSLTSPLSLGLRLQAALSFPFVGVVGWLDLLRDDELATGWLALRVSL